MTRRTLLAAPALLGAQDIHTEIGELAAHAPLRWQFSGGDAAAWQHTFRAKLAELLGSFPHPAQWETVEERVVEFKDHRRRELLLRAPGFRPLPVYLLTPVTGTGKRPGVLALHGHGAFGHDPVVGIDTTEERRKSIAQANYAYGLELVRRGYVVAAPCFTPFGRRLGDANAYRGEDPCGVTFIRMQALGKVLMAENLRDALWTLELLARDPAVDAARLGCVGLSYGGRMTMLAAAMEPRIHVAVISGALNMMQERILGRYSCGAQIIPGLLEYGDVPEIGGLIAPRPCVWEVGNQDALMVKDRIPAAMERLRRVYAALGAEDQLGFDFFDGGHRWNGDKAYPLLARVLRP